MFSNAFPGATGLRRLRGGKDHDQGQYPDDWIGAGAASEYGEW